MGFEVNSLTQQLIFLSIYTVEGVLFAENTQILVYIHTLIQDVLFELIGLLVGPRVEHQLVQHSPQIIELQI